MTVLRAAHPQDAGVYFGSRGRPSQADMQEYVDFLQGLQTDQPAEARPSNGETLRAIKRRLTMAAKSQGMKIQYSRKAPDGALVFRIR